MLYRRESKELYVRAHHIGIENQLGETPNITFHEQFATMDGLVVDGRLGSCALEMTDPTESFPLYHPETGTELGTLTYAELQVALYSLYLYAASKRDDKLAELEAIEPVADESPADWTGEPE